MGFLSGIFGAAVKTVLTPVAILKDAVNVVTGEEVNDSKKLLESAGDDIEKSVDDLADGDLI